MADVSKIKGGIIYVQSQEAVEPKPTTKANNFVTNKLDIYDAVKPFFWLVTPFGLQQMSFAKNANCPTSRPFRMYSLALALAIVSAQSYNVYNKTMTDYDAMSASSVVTDLLLLIPATISTVISLIMCASCNQRMMLRILDNVVHVDAKLGIDRQDVYRPLRRNILLALAVIVPATVVHYYFHFCQWSEFKSALTVADLATYLIKELMLLEVTMMVFIQATRLGVMNKQIEALKDGAVVEIFYMHMKKKKRDVGDGWTFNNIRPKENSAETIFENGDSDDGDDEVDAYTRLMRVYDKIVDNAHMINSCFGIQMLSASIAVFINILQTVNILISKSSKGDSKDVMSTSIEGTIFWCIRDLFFVIFAVISSEMLQSKVKDTSDAINKVSISKKIDPYQQDLLERFAQLLSCRKTTLTACNFFPFDFTFIYSLVGAVATYTVILLQVNQANVQKEKEETMTESYPGISTDGYFTPNYEDGKETGNPVEYE